MATRKIGLVLVVSAGTILGWPSPAMAQDLSSALELESEGQLEAALRAFEEVLSTPGNSRRDLATIYQHLGLLRFAAGDEPGAREAMLRLLAVDPEATLPDAAPPELGEMLQRARERWEGRRLRVEIEGAAEEAGDDDVEVSLRAVDDLAQMVGAVEVVEGGTVLADRTGSGPWEVLIPESIFEDGRARLTVRLLDEAGGVLWEDELTVRLAPDEEGGRGGLRISPRTQRILAWSLIGGGGALVLGGGIAVGVDGTATGEYRVVGGVLEQEVRATATGGWVLISAGLAAAVGGLVLLLLTPRGPDSEEASDLFLIGALTP